MRERIESIIKQKKSRLCVALDVSTSAKFFDILDKIAPHICMIKTHVDIIEDFTPAFVTLLVAHADKHNYLIFEDRKFADIGNTVQLQYEKGVYHISSWAHLVNAHPVVGPGVLQALEKSIAHRKDRGVLLLAQMSAAGTLIDEPYTKAAVEMARTSKCCIGFIGNGSNPADVRRLRSLAGPEYLILTPGINLQHSGDSLSQQYGSPQQALEAGADILIVGRDIYGADDPEAAARMYQELTQ